MDLSNVNFNLFRADVEKALAAVAEKYGCDVTAGKIKYDDISINLSLDFKARGENGESGEQVEFNSLCRQYGFAPENYREELWIDGETYFLVGFLPNARKYHCLMEDAAGKKYKVTIDTVRHGINERLGEKDPDVIFIRGE